LEELNQLIRIRREKLDQLQELDVNPYPYNFEQTNFSTEILENFEGYENRSVSIAGRMMSVRLMGKAAFFHLQDSRGRIQVYLRQDRVGEKEFAVFKILDIGDHIGIGGTVFKTKTGEVTILAEHF
jgi:lysyl-tRNA synthetase class 2